MTQGLSYNVDIVFCVDVSYSMNNRLGEVKQRILKFSEDFRRKELSRGIEISKMRAKIVTFGDSKIDSHSLWASHFFLVSEHDGAQQFAALVDHLDAREQQKGIHRSGLEALAVAMASDWVQDGDRQRHIIVMFTDASAHRLEDRVGDIPAAHTSQIPTSIDELTAIWEFDEEFREATTLKQPARRLVLFAPDMYPWPTIGDSWAQTVFLPSKAGEGLAEVDYDTILQVLTFHLD